MALEPAAISLLLHLTQARIGDTLHDGNGTRVTVVNAFTTENPATEAYRSSRRLPGGRCARQFRLFADDAGDVARWRRVEGAAFVTAATGEARRDLWEADIELAGSEAGPNPITSPPETTWIWSDLRFLSPGCYWRGSAGVHPRARGAGASRRPAHPVDRGPSPRAGRGVVRGKS